MHQRAHSQICTMRQCLSQCPICPPLSHLYQVVQWDPMGCTTCTTTDPHCPTCPFHLSCTMWYTGTTDPHCPTCPSHPICTMWYNGIPWDVPWAPPLTHTVPHVRPIPSVPCGTMGSHGMYHGHHHWPTLSHMSVPSHLYHVVHWDPMGCTMGTTTGPQCPTCPSHPICTMWYTGIPWDVPWAPPLAHSVPHVRPIPSVPCGTLGSHGMYHGHQYIDYSSKVITMATCIHSCLPPFYTIPIFPHLNRKIFHLLVSLPW